MTFADFIKTFSALVNSSVSAGLATSQQVNNVTTAPPNVLQVFGIALLTKIHRNVFVTFSRGIFKTDRVLSADFSIIDNSFLLCTEVGIELGGGGGGRTVGFLNEVLGRFINLRHLVQSNALAVFGRGIISSVPLTQVDQNSVNCPSVGIELAGPRSSAHNNTLQSVGREATAPPEEGLLILHRGANEVVIRGNRLRFAAGHGILLLDDLSDVVIEDNHIEFANRFAIGTFTEVTVLRQSNISRNQIVGCRGEVPTPPLGQPIRVGGAVVIGESLNARFLDNVVDNNSASFPPNSTPPWFAVNFEDATGLEISGNQVTNNVNVPDRGPGVGAIRLARVGGAIRFQDNVVRDNGGRSLWVIGAVKPQVHRVLIQNNHFMANANSTGILVLAVAIDTLSFQGNQCTVSNPALTQARDVSLIANIQANVSNNVVDLPRISHLTVGATDALVNANSVRAEVNSLVVTATRAIVTSNLTTGIFASAAQLVRANNIP
jgi:hypothetical protein